MRPKITPEEVALLVEDLDMLGEQNLVGIEAYEALYLLEMILTRHFRTAFVS